MLFLFWIDEQTIQKTQNIFFQYKNIYIYLHIVLYIQLSQLYNRENKIRFYLSSEQVTRIRMMAEFNVKVMRFAYKITASHVDWRWAFRGRQKRSWPRKLKSSRILSCSGQLSPDFVLTQTRFEIRGNMILRESICWSHKTNILLFRYNFY